MQDKRWTSTSDLYLTPGTGNAWATEAAASGQLGTQRVLFAGPQRSSDLVAAALGLDPGDTVVLRQRLMSLDGQPVEVTDSYYPLRVAEGTALAAPAKIQGGAVSLLASLGYEPADVREDLTARLPTAEEQQMLSIGATEPVIVLTRLSIASDGRPFEYSEMTMVARGRHLTYRKAA